MSGWAGDEFLYFVALAILDEHRDSLKYLMTFDEVLKVLSNFTTKINNYNVSKN